MVLSMSNMAMTLIIFSPVKLEQPHQSVSEGATVPPACYIQMEMCNGRPELTDLTDIT